MLNNEPTDCARQVELILQQIEALPTLSPVAVRLLRISSADDPDLDEIVALIESDPALTVKLLGLCRRAAHGLSGRITTVRRAAIMLGLEAVQSAVLSVQVYELLAGATRQHGAAEDAPAAAEFGAPTFDRRGYWKHSIAVACAAELIAEAHAPGPHPPRARHALPEEHFVAGLLHGLGRLVLDLVLPHTYRRVLTLAERRRCESAAVERSLIGLDHHTAGKRLAEHWGLPHALQDVVWLHGQPAGTLPDLPHRPLIATVSAARTLCRHLHIGWSGDFSPTPGIGAACEEAGLDRNLVESVVPRLHESVAERCAALGLEQTTPPALLLESVVAANRRLGRLNGALEHRSRATRRQAACLSAIAAFCGAWRPGRGVVDTLGEVARSAASLLGPGFYATVFQSRPGELWQLCQFSADGVPVRTQLIEPPPSHGGGSLAELLDPARLSMGALGLLPWLSDSLADACDIRSVQLVALGPAGLDDGSREGPAALLLHDREPGPEWPDRASLAALTSAWGAAVAAAAQHEGARRLGERLADANRQLAETQEELAEAQSLARLGQMAAGAAHEMNNPLCVISGRAQLLAQRLDAGREREDAKSIAKAAGQLSDLITNLKLIADPPSPCPARVRIGDAIRSAIERAEERSSTRGRVRMALDGPGPEVFIDRELLALALAEIIANGLEASAGDPVEVSLQSDDLEGHVVIVVKDHGAGMSAKTLQHAFDPFYSDKPAGRRTGLGLTRARRLLELQGVHIRLASEPGRGTTATITLPSADSGGASHQRPTERAA